MYRRLVSLLLLPCLMLTQSASLGHHHDGNQPAGHDLCPHFHFDSILPSDNHCHHHHGHGGHQHHDDADDEPKQASQPLDEPLSDHDGDAIYVAVDAILSRWDHPSDELVVSVPCMFALSECIGYFYPESGQAFDSHPPPPPASCPPYLRNLVLLI